MEKLYFTLPGYRMALLQIGQNCSRIEMTGNHSYGVCGKDVILYLVDVDDEVVGLRLVGGYVNRIKTASLGEWFSIMVEVFTRQAGANPELVTKDFYYEWVDVL